MVFLSSGRSSVVMEEKSWCTDFFAENPRNKIVYDILSLLELYDHTKTKKEFL